MGIKRGLKPSIAEVGKIKIGEKGKEITSKKGNKFQPPVRLDYFKVTTTERGPDGNYIKDKTIEEKLGKEPKELRIRLPFDTIDKNFFTQFMAYCGNKKVCSGDGESAVRTGILSIKNDKLVQRGDEQTEGECNPEECPIFKAGKCKVCGILSAFLADAPNVGGLHKFRTHGWNSCSTILGALEYFFDNTGGILQGLPLKLVMVKKTTQDHGTINYATVVIDGEELMGLRRLALEEKKSRAVLMIDMNKIEQDAEAAGFFKDSDPEDMIQAEFYNDDQPETEPEKGTSGEDLADKLKNKAPDKTTPKKTVKKPLSAGKDQAEDAEAETVSESDKVPEPDKGNEDKSGQSNEKSNQPEIF